MRGLLSFPPPGKERSKEKRWLCPFLMVGQWSILLQKATMSVRTDVINMSININGDKGKDELNQLQKKAAQLKAEMADQNRKTKEGREKWKELNAEYAVTNQRIVDLRKGLGLAALSQKELTSELKRLQQLKNIATPQTKEFFELQNQIDAVSSRLKNVRNGTFGFKAALGSIKAEVLQFGVLATSYLGFEFLTSQVSNLIAAQKKMADQNADIKKTTGLTKQEVQQLNEELKTMDTRTSNSKLRELATDAGKLGIEGVEGIKKFVEQADKINVALGEDLGDGAINKLAKIAQIFDTEMTNIASGINAVGQASAASESYQVDFAFRMAGTSQTARIAAGDILGYAAALEVNGQQTELAATALNTFFLDFISKSDQFGKAAGFAKGELGKLINDKGANAAFLQWLENLKALSPTTEAFIEKMRSLGIDGARGSNVMLVLSENIDLVREQQKLANTEIAKGTSIIDEYNEKNNNFAATVDKVSKQINSLVTSGAINEMIVGTVNGFSSFLSVLPNILTFLKDNISSLGVWTAALIVNTSWGKKFIEWISLSITGLKGQTAAQILSTAAAKADIIATTTLGMVKALLTGNLAKLRAEWLLLNTVIGSNPLSAALVLIGATIFAVQSLTRSSKELTEIQKYENELRKRTVESSAAQFTQLVTLRTGIENVNLSMNKRIKASQDLQRLFPEIFGNLKTEEILAGKVASAYQKAAESIQASAASRVFSEQMGEISAKMIDLETYIEQYQAKSKTKIEKKTSFNGANLGFALENDLQLPKDVYNSIVQYNKLLAEQSILLTKIEEVQTATIGPKVQLTSTQTEEVIGSLRQKIQALDEDLDRISIKDKAAIAANRAERAKLQKELDAIDGKKNGGDKSGLVDRVKRELDALKIEMDAAITNGSMDEKTAQKFALRLENIVTSSTKKLIKMAGIEEAKSTLAQLFFLPDQKKIDAQYETSQQSISDNINKQRQLVHQDYINEIIDKSEHSLRLQLLDEQEIIARAALAEKFKNISKKAADDTEKLKTQALELGIKNREDADKKALADKVAQAEIEMLKANAGSKKELDAHIAFLKAKHKAEMEQNKLTADERKAAEAKLNAEILDLTANFLRQRIEMYARALNDTLSSLNSYASAVNTSEQNDLQNYQSRNEKKKEHYKNLLDRNIISKGQYEKEVAKLDKEADKRQREYNKKAFQRQKALAIANALMSTFEGAVRSYKDYPYPFNMIVSGIVTGLGLATVAEIASTEPPIGRKGLIVPGSSHEQGGVDLVDRSTGKTVANVEGGEPLWVFSKKTYANNKDILDQLIYNSMYRDGAALKLKDPLQSRTISSDAVPMMRKGGIAGNNNGFSDIDMDRFDALFSMLALKLDENKAEIATMKTKLKAVVVMKDVREADFLEQKSRAVGGINQG